MTVFAIAVARATLLPCLASTCALLCSAQTTADAGVEPIPIAYRDLVIAGDWESLGAVLNSTESASRSNFETWLFGIAALETNHWAEGFSALEASKEHSSSIAEHAIELSRGSPDSPNLALLAAIALLARGHDVDAVEHLRRAHDLGSSSPQFYTTAANAFLVQQDFQQAEDLFSQALILNADRVDALVGRALCSIELDALPNARSDIDKAMQLAPETGTLFVLDAMVKRSEGRPGAALRSLLAAARVGGVDKADISIMLRLLASEEKRLKRGQ